MGVRDVTRLMGEARLRLLLLRLEGVCSGRGDTRCMDKGEPHGMDMNEGESSIGVVIGKRVLLLDRGVRETDGVMGLSWMVLVKVPPLVVGVAIANLLVGVLVGVVIDVVIEVVAVVLVVAGVVVIATAAADDDDDDVVVVRATLTGMGRITCTHLYISRWLIVLSPLLWLLLSEGEEDTSSACSCTVAMSLLLLFVPLAIDVLTRLIGLKVGLKATGTAVTSGPRRDVGLGVGVAEVGVGDS